VAVEGVGDVLVRERQGVGVLAKCGGGVGVAESGQGLQDFAAGNEEGGDAVPDWRFLLSRARQAAGRLAGRPRRLENDAGYLGFMSVEEFVAHRV
jgi:hypothetical protein